MPKSTMRYETLQHYNNQTFKRLTGVDKDLFAQMVKVIESAYHARKRKGRTHSLSFEDQVLMTLNYLRTYKSQLELASIYNLSDSNVSRTIIKIENTLIQSGLFDLPKRSHKPSNGHDDAIFDYVILDATEVPCQRPKKSKDTHTVVSKNSTP